MKTIKFNKITKTRTFLVRFISYLCLFLSNKNISVAALVVYFLFTCQIPPGYLQIKFASLHIVKTQLFLTAYIVINIVNLP
jgi:hypothetical protein